MFQVLMLLCLLNQPAEAIPDALRTEILKRNEVVSDLEQLDGTIVNSVSAVAVFLGEYDHTPMWVTTAHSVMVDLVTPNRNITIRGYTANVDHCGYFDCIDEAYGEFRDDPNDVRHDFAYLSTPGCPEPWPIKVESSERTGIYWNEDIFRGSLNSGETLFTCNVTVDDLVQMRVINTIEYDYSDTLIEVSLEKAVLSGSGVFTRTGELVGIFLGMRSEGVGTVLLVASYGVSAYFEYE